MQNVDERTKQVWQCESRRVRTHHSTPGAAVRRLGRIIDRIFMLNQEAELVEPFGNGPVRVGSQGFFDSALLVNLRRFISLPELFPLVPINRPWVSEAVFKSAGTCWSFYLMNATRKLCEYTVDLLRK